MNLLERLIKKRPQQPLTVRATIREGQTEQLERSLAEIGADPARNTILPFARFDNVHFARLVVLDTVRDVKGHTIPGSLLLATDVDGDPEVHIQQLGAEAGLDRVFGHCEGYPERVDPDTRAMFLRAHRIKTSTFYVNTLGRTVKQVRQEAELRNRIEDYLDQEDWNGCTASEIRGRVQNFVSSQPDLTWVTEVPKDFNPKMWEPIRRRLDRFDIAGLLDLVRRILSFIPNNDLESAKRPPNEHVRTLTWFEDREPQNPFSAVGFPKAGGFLWIRGLITQIPIKILFRVADWFTHAVFNNGNLANVQSIHFARWVPIDYARSPFVFRAARRVCFFSSYDGSQENYMTDFVDKVAWGLNATFSRAIGYPRSLLLVFDGAKNEQVFKAFVRTAQIPTQVWYSAYPNLTAANIHNNAEIRKGLFVDMSDSQAQNWLHRF